MKTTVLKTWAFWAGFGLCEVATFMAVLAMSVTGWSAPENWSLRVVIMALVAVLYFLDANWSVNELSRVRKKETIQRILACVEAVRHLVVDQNLRSNIFFYDKKRKVYYIVYQYNMTTDDDRGIELPENMGCTGEAWRAQTQTWGDKGHILKEGNHKVPEDQVRKIRSDLEWICSTPIRRGRKVVAVMNFDGNRLLSAAQKEVVKQHANRVATELSEII